MWEFNYKNCVSSFSFDFIYLRNVSKKIYNFISCSILCEIRASQCYTGNDVATACTDSLLFVSCFKWTSLNVLRTSCISSVQNLMLSPFTFIVISSNQTWQPRQTNKTIHTHAHTHTHKHIYRWFFSAVSVDVFWTSKSQRKISLKLKVPSYRFQHSVLDTEKWIVCEV